MPFEVLGAILGEGGAALGEAAAGEALGPAAANIGRAAGQSIAKAIQERRRKMQACNNDGMAFPDGDPQAFPDCPTAFR